MRFDVLIAGAGPAGAVAAWVLARCGRRVLLADDGLSTKPRVGESLPGAARPILRDLGLLYLVESDAHLPSYGNISAWGTSELIATDFIRDPNGPGWHLDRTRFDADLGQAAQKAGAILYPSRVRSVTTKMNGWHIHFADREIETRWFIDATGRSARLVRSIDVRRQRDDSLVALYTWARPAETDTDTRTLVEAAPYGWWYTARLPLAARVVVLHVDGDEAASILQTPGAWSTLLSRTVYVSDVLAGATFNDNLYSTEACGARLDHFAGEGWVAVGDAALSFDPLASQGILNAMYTGMKAGQAVHAALNGAPDQAIVYTRQLENIRQAYLQHHRAYYQLENRWPDEPFWARRSSSP